MHNYGFGRWFHAVSHNSTSKYEHMRSGTLQFFGMAQSLGTQLWPRSFNNRSHPRLGTIPVIYKVPKYLIMKHLQQSCGGHLAELTPGSGSERIDSYEHMIAHSKCLA
jgi:hypothetical protein